LGVQQIQAMLTSTMTRNDDNVVLLVLTKLIDIEYML